jgi:outer membrane protein assembly factor BamB
VGSCDHSLHAINYDGTAKWSYATGSWIQSSPAIDDSGFIHIAGYDTDLYSFEDSVTYGKKRWNYNTGGNSFSDPAVGTDGMHYCGSCDQRFYAIDKDGNFQWSYLAGGNFYYSSAAIGTDGTIYVGANDNRLHAINPDGSQKWTYLTGGYINGCPALATDGTIYIGSRDDNLYAIEDSITYGRLKWAYATSGDISYASPIIDANGVIYVGSCDHNLYAIEDSVTYGNLKWNITLDSDIWAAPAIGPDSVLYIVSTGGTVYAIGEGATGVELTNFTATSEQNRIILNWRTAQESQSVLWYILKRNIKDEPGYTEIGRVNARETTPTPTEYSYVDDEVIVGCIYHYKLGLMKTDGNTDWYGPVSAQAMGAKGTLTVFPNPFSSATTITLRSESEKRRNGETVIQIFDVSGRQVRQISLLPFSFSLGAKVTWDGRDDEGKVLSPGVYFIKAGGKPVGKVVKAR